MEKDERGTGRTRSTCTMSPTVKKIVAALVALAFLAPVGWRVGGEWGLALTVVLLIVAANVWGRVADRE
jgi:hypothetical protein